MIFQQRFCLTGEETGYWFVSQYSKLWLPKGDVPFGTAKEFGFNQQFAQFIGELNGQPAWLVCKNMPADMSNIRSLLHDQPLFLLAGRAVQLSEFYRSHKYCGYCGNKMYISETEWCCMCSSCKQRYYPQIAPSVIVAIRRNNKILLAKHVRHQQENLYTVLAGFVEVGETIEQAVHREIFEESSICVKNLRYVASQPWPFPNSIMMAYLADYDSGELEIDKTELADANWYHYDELPKIPEYGTIARQLIEETIVLCRQYDEFGE